MKNGCLRLIALAAALLMVSGCGRQALRKDIASGAADDGKAGVAAARAGASQAAMPTEQPLPGPDPSTQLQAEAALAADPPAPAPQVAPSQSLATVYFAVDSVVLDAAARDVLTRNAGLLLAEKRRIRIEGHCDERGSEEYNMALGEKRAQSARRYLTTLGVAADDLAVLSYGKEKPAVQGHDEASWAKNRRVEFVVQ